MIVPSQNANTVSALPIPYSNSLIIRRTQDPRVLVVEEGGSNVIQMTQQGE